MSSLKTVVEYEREYGEAMAKALKYNPRASLHAITSPYWDAVSYALTHYEPSRKGYGKESLIVDAVNLAKSKLRSKEVRYDVLEQVAGSIRGLLEFILDYADHFPKQKVWEVARAIRRSLGEQYYDVVWKHIQERKEKKEKESSNKKE